MNIADGVAVWHCPAFAAPLSSLHFPYSPVAAAILVVSNTWKRRNHLPPIISAQGLSKRFGVLPLFQNVSFAVSEGDRIGLIGPNGSGKSTLLRILAGDVRPDSGEIAVRKRIRLSYVEQDSKFKPGDTVRSVAQSAMERASVPESERGTRFAETLGRAGFENLDASASALSGGWQKRLAIVEALVQGPDILLLDEPTNHLDLAGIEWLEALLQATRFLRGR